MPVPFRSTVHRIVLRARVRLKIRGVVPLQAADDSETHAGSQKWVLSVSFHSPAPSGIAEYVYIRSPEGQALVTVIFLLLLVIVVLGARLVADHLECTVHLGIIKRGGEGDRLREDSCVSRAGNAVQSLVPPVVRRNSEARDGRSLVHHLTNLLFRRQAAEQVGDTFVDRQIRIAEWKIRLFFSARRSRKEGHGGDRENFCFHCQ